MENWKDFKNKVLQDKNTAEYKLIKDKDAVIFRSCKTYGGERFIFTEDGSMHIAGLSSNILLIKNLTIQSMEKIYNTVNKDTEMKMKWEEFRDIMLKKEKDGVKEFKVNGNNNGFIFKSDEMHGGREFVFTDNRCMYFMNWCGIVLLFKDLTFERMLDIYNAVE